MSGLQTPARLELHRWQPGAGVTKRPPFRYSLQPGLDIITLRPPPASTFQDSYSQLLKPCDAPSLPGAFFPPSFCFFSNFQNVTGDVSFTLDVCFLTEKNSQVLPPLSASPPLVEVFGVHVVDTLLKPFLLSGELSPAM